MKLNPKLGVFTVLLAVSYVLVMFGTRFVTLRFGQVFPNQSEAEKKRLAVIESQLKQLDPLNARIAHLESENTRLSSELEAAKNAPPVVIHDAPVTPEVKAEPPSPRRRLPQRNTVAHVEQDQNDDVVHRGDSQEKVRRVFGRPTKVDSWPIGERWYYGGYDRYVHFVDGHVTEWGGMDVEP